MPDDQTSPPPQPLTNSQRRLYKASYRPLTVPPPPPQEEGRGRVLEKLAFLRGLNIQPQEFARLESDAAAQGQASASTDTQGTDSLRVIEGLATDLSFAAMRRYGPLLANIHPEELIRVGNALAEMRRTVAADGEQQANQIASLINFFKYQAELEPVGQLHLERLEMTPAGIEHGELVHSVPLTPKETVNITHREWSVTTSTFENIVQDSFEGFSETGVAEKTDLAQSTDNEVKHSSGLDVNGSVSASYNGGAYSATVSAAVDYRQQTDTQQIEKNSVAHSLAITRNASARTKKDHKISFRVSSVAGAEDLSVRVITNPSDTNAMRVDYFQLLRKWRVDLIRYGLRMTYDLVIPNPGLDLIGRTLEIQAIDELLTTASYSFGLHIDDVTRDKWLALSEQYGVELDPPPEQSLPIAYFKKLDPATEGVLEGDVEIEIPEGYEFEGGSMIAELHNHPPRSNRPQFETFDGKYTTSGDDDDHKFNLKVPLDLGSFAHTTGKLLIRYSYDHSDDGSIEVRGPTGASGFLVLYKTIDEWQLKSWTALKDADQAAYSHRIEQAKERKAFLEAEIAAFDALTLRKMERVEIMRWVLRWLLGPGFELMPANLQALFRGYPDPGTVSNAITAGAQTATPSSMAGITSGTRLTIDPGLAHQETVIVTATTATTFTATFAKTHAAGAVIQIDPPSQYAYPDVSQLGSAWQGIINHGEFIKYIHDAVEWENILFFAYPYFWDTVKNWPFKRFLRHPDPIHREFLRSGAMRIVLTIRPGFEASFAMLQKTGDSTAPPNKSFPYVTIAEDIRNFALTNYEGIPPANPDNNVRPLLYPEQRRAWNDMQKLIQLIEAYNDAQHKRTISNAITPTTPPTPQTVTPSSMEGIAYGTKLIIDTDAFQEAVTVTATAATTFTATFLNPHLAGVVFTIDPAVKMYPTTSEFPTVIQAFAGNTPLPLTDPWGNPYHYTSPGLNADYDLVCYGKDGIAEQDQTAQQRADPLNKNITSYAEGSVVGRWYEYTPTGAMDVSINTVLPTTPQAA